KQPVWSLRWSAATKPSRTQWKRQLWGRNEPDYLPAVGIYLLLRFFAPLIVHPAHAKTLHIDFVTKGLSPLHDFIIFFLITLHIRVAYVKTFNALSAIFIFIADSQRDNTVVSA